MTQLENLVRIFQEENTGHELLEQNPEISDYDYASLYLNIQENIDESVIKTALSLELLAVSYRLHFLNQQVNSLSLIKGDYFYSRALKRTVEAGSIEAVKILSLAVLRESTLRAEGFKGSLFPSLIAAAGELSLLQGVEKKRIDEAIKNFLSVKKSAKRYSTNSEDVEQILISWGWLI